MSKDRTYRVRVFNRDTKAIKHIDIIAKSKESAIAEANRLGFDIVDIWVKRTSGKCGTYDKFFSGRSLSSQRTVVK